MSEFVLTPEFAGRAERVFLNPGEVATADRIERNLHSGAIQVREEGIDWGDQAIEAFMVQRAIGAIPIDSQLPNRVIAIPLSLGLSGDFDEARIALQAEVGRINEEGGTLKRELIGGTYGEAGSHLFADLVKATLKLGGGTFQASDGIDPNAELILEALPDFYGDEIEEEPFEGTGGASETFQIKGNLPGRTNLTVTEKSGQDQLGFGWHFRCRNYSADEGAAWAYEAEDLTPLDLASIATLSGASPSGSAANNAVLHNNLGTEWTPVLSTNRLPKVRAVAAAKAGTGAITPALPTGVKENDILVMFLETENQAVTVPAGWAHVSGSPVEVASGTTTRLTVLWKRAGASESAPTIEDPGDHVIARIMAVSGCIQTGNPWDVKATGTELVSDTSVAIPGATTTVDGCLVIAAVATGADVSSSPHASAWTNANLQALTERMDSWTEEGGGGGFGVVTGIKLIAGAYGETTATVAPANFKALMSFALKPETGGNFLTHKGLYDIWARVYSTSEELPWLRLLWDVGDIVAPSENTQVRIPGVSNFYLVNLGQVNIREMPIGTHRWQAIVQARGEVGGENVYVDRLEFGCADEGSGIITGNSWSAGPVSATYLVRDEFNQEAGKATGKSAAVGGIYAEAANSDTNDFEVDATTHRLKRTAESDTGTIGGKGFFKGRGIGTPTEFTTLAMRSDFKLESTNLGLVYVGHLLSYVNNENFVLVKLRWIEASSHFEVSIWKAGGSELAGKYVAAPGPTSVEGVSHSPEATLVSVINGNTLSVYLVPIGGRAETPIISVQDAMIGVKGKAYLYDEYNGAGAATRWFDNLSIWKPETDAAIYANGNASLNWQGIYRQSEDGLAGGPVAYPGSDLPRIPASGSEGRPVEVAVRGLDKISVQLSYRPCWSGVPED